MHLFPFHNEPSLMPVGWKLWEKKALKWPEMSRFRRVVHITNIREKLKITHKELIEGIKAWILLGYPSNMLGYPSKYCNYTSIKTLGQFPHSPTRPRVCNFFNTHLTKNIIQNIKDVEFDFRMSCLLVLFMFLRIINVQFSNLLIFVFLIFIFSKLAILAYFYRK